MLKLQEFDTLFKVVENLNYYQILKITPLASSRDIQDAFHREALAFHPDRYMGMKNEQLLSNAKIMYAKVVEAYSTLSDKNKRAEYDARISGKTLNKITPTKTAPVNEDDITSPTVKKTVLTSSGAKYLKLAQSALQSGNLQGAKMNIQFALSSDPHHSDVLQLSTRIEQALKKKVGAK